MRWMLRVNYSSGMRLDCVIRCSWCLSRLSFVNLVLSPYSAAPQPMVTIAISPAVNGALNQTAFLPQANVQGRQSPADSIALSFVLSTIALVFFLRFAGSRVDAVRGLELISERVLVDRFDITTDRVLHLHAVSGVVERYPLDSVLILMNDLRSRGGYRARSCGLHRLCRRSKGHIRHTGRALVLRCVLLSWM